MIHPTRFSFTPRQRAWLQLFRAPNLFTVPGDALAGYLLGMQSFVGGDLGRIFLAVGASLFFYAAGLALNDLFDLEEDRAIRPDRPLPSGAIETRHAWAAAMILLATGSLFCLIGGIVPLIMGACLVLAIVTYNGASKNRPVLGPLNMGLCRGLSLLLGACFGAGIDDLVMSAACLLILYVAAVTALARDETSGSAPLWARWLPVFAVLAGGAFFVWTDYVQDQFVHPAGPRLPLMTLDRIVVIPCLAAALGITILAALKLSAIPPPSVPPFIGSLVRALIFLQAAFCAASLAGLAGLIFTVLLLALWPVSLIVGRRFYAS